MPFHTDAARWRALTSRDPNANGHFVYSVKTTNIYCRPSCPARLARRANIGFYLTPAEAEAAGFRACKRCKPDHEIKEDPQERAVAKACDLIEEALHGNNPKTFRLQDLAKSVGLTPRYFHKIFKDKTAMTPKEYAKTRMAMLNDESLIEIPRGGQMSLEPFNPDSFDFNDLIDFDMDATLPLDNTTLEMPEQISTVQFGQEVNVNIQTSPWSETINPNALGAEFHIVNDKLGTEFVAVPEANSLSWKFEASMTATVSTFELDAALLLSDAELNELVPELGTEALRTLVQT